MRTLSSIIFLTLCLVTLGFTQEGSFNQLSSGDNFSENKYLKGLEYAIAGNFKEAEEELKVNISHNHLMMVVLNDAQKGKIQK